MANQQPTAATDAPPRPLRRRTAERVIGGVAGGIADYVNVDPVLVRVAFVGLMIFGGAGIVLYVGGWLLIPLDGQQHSAAEAFFRRLNLTTGRAALVALFVLAAYLAILVLTDGGVSVSVLGPLVLGALLIIGIVLLRRDGPSQARLVSTMLVGLGGLTAIWLLAPRMGYVGLDEVSTGDGTFLLLVLVFVGILLLSRNGGSAAVTTGGPVSAAATGPATAAEAVPPVAAAELAAPPPPRARAPRSPLGWYVVAATLVCIGLFALADQALDITVLPGQFFGIALSAIGIGLVVGSWWGHTRILILPALLLLPVAGTAMFLTAPLEGGTGDQLFVPRTTGELRAEYRLLSGRLTLDLSELDAGDEPVEIVASVGMGGLAVVLPPEARIDIRSGVGAGYSQVLGSSQYGTDLADRYVRGERGPRFVLDLQAGIGQVLVQTAREH